MWRKSYHKWKRKAKLRDLEFWPKYKKLRHFYKPLHLIARTVANTLMNIYTKERNTHDFAKKIHTWVKSCFTYRICSKYSTKLVWTCLKGISGILLLALMKYFSWPMFEIFGKTGNQEKPSVWRCWERSREDPPNDVPRTSVWYMGMLLRCWIRRLRGCIWQI